MQLTLVWNEECYRDATPKLQLLAKDLRSTHPELFHSIWANFRYSSSMYAHTLVCTTRLAGYLGRFKRGGGGDTVFVVPPQFLFSFVCSFCFSGCLVTAVSCVVFG